METQAAQLRLDAQQLYSDAEALVAAEAGSYLDKVATLQGRIDAHQAMIADNEQRITQIELLINPNPVTKSEQQSNDKWLSGSRYFCGRMFWASKPKQAANT